MSYSDIYFRPKQSKLLFIVAGIVLVIFGIFIYFSRANSTPLEAVGKTLKRQEIVNVSPHQAGIFWVSDVKETGWVLYGTSKDSLPLIAIDERDLSEKKNLYTLHYVLLKGLEENKVYYYKIVSGKNVVTSGSQQPFSLKTPQSTNLSSDIRPAYGKITLANGEPAQNAFVFYKYKNAVPFFTLTKLTGEWLLPLQYAINKNTNEAVPIIASEKINIEVISENEVTTNIEALVSKTNPLPQTIIVGKNYKFLQEDNVLPASTKRVDDTKEYPVSIIFPKDKAFIPGSKPLLKGQGVPGKPVKIQINSQPGYISRITSDEKGDWKVEVPVSLAAGTYTMTVTTEDSSTKSVILTRKFTIAKSGEQVLGIATPSATIIPSISPTASPSATIAILESPSPTVTFPLFTATPVSSITGRLVVSGTPPGFNGSPFLFGSIGLIVVGVGIMLVF